MKKITINLIIIIIVVFSIFTFVKAMDYRTVNADFVSCAEETDTGHFYLAGSVMKQDIVYRVNSEGHVTNMYTEKFQGTKEPIYEINIADLCSTGTGVYYIADAKGQDGTDYYRLVQLSTWMRKEMSVIASDFPSGVKASKLNVIDSTAYLSMLSADRQTVYVYSMDLNAEPKTWSLFKTQKADEGRYFIEAIYNGTVIQAGLDDGSYVFYDAGTGTDLTDDSNMLIERAKMLSEHQITLSSVGIMLRAAQKIVFQNLLQTMLCILIVIILYYMFTSRFYAVKQFAILDLSFVILATAALTFVVKINSDNIKNTYMNDVQLNFDYFTNQFSADNAYFLDAADYFNSEDYSRSFDELAEFAERTGYVKELVLLYRNGTNEQVLASLNSYRNVAEKKVINAQVGEMINEASGTALPVHRAATVLGEEYAIYVTPLRDNTVITKYIVSVVSMGAADYQNNSFLKYMLLVTLIIFIFTTLGALLTVRLMTKDVRELSKAMMADTEAAVMKKKPNVHNNEIEYLWNALGEMTKRYETVNYAKYQVMQAYYRFAPRKIEEVLGRESITDVKIGDLVNVKGTMAMISLGEDRNVGADDYMSIVNRDLETIGEFQTADSGIIVSKNSNLTYLKMLFLAQSGDAVKFSIDTIQAFEKRSEDEKEEVFILLHSSEFMYGVTGNSEQTFPFTVSSETEDMDEYIESFKKAKVGLVATESVALRPNLKNSSRYIGYIVLKTSGREVKLYQIFEPFSVRIRNKFLAEEPTFQKALQNFRENSIFEARNGFTEVLKNNASDEIARWYLFECEKYLNNPDRHDRFYGLFQSDAR